jgi:LTXXQ motif family protein
MSRHPARAVLTALSVLTFVPIVSAQQPGHPMPHGGAPAMPHPAAAAPHMAAPAAPHFAAPAPHMAAPAPHMAAPAPRMAAPAPHFAAPAPHMAAPHVAAPRIAAPPRSFAAHAPPPRAMAHTAAPPHAAPQISRGHTGPSPRFATGEARRGNIAAHAPPAITQNAATPPAVPNASRHAVGPSTGPDVNRAERPNAPRPGETVGQRQGGFRPGETVGVARSDRGTAEAARARVEESRKTPILRSPVFAGQSPRSMRMSPSQWTFRGRYAQSAFAGDHRHHHHHLGVVLGFAGAVFWPYAYDDFVNYTFSPYAYDTFWPYAYDDVYAGIFGGYAPQYYASENAYAYAGSAASTRAYSRIATSGGASQSAAADRICSGEAKGVTDFAIEKIAAQVGPDQNQKDLLDALKAASVKAVGIMQNACPGELPSTPTGRLAAMLSRVDTMLKAVETVRPALDKFYQSLNDEQRERFNALDQGEQANRSQSRADLNHLCQGQTTTKSDLPVDKIQRTLNLNTNQSDRLKALDEATIESAKMLQAQCQPDQTLTPTGRLAAMEDRLKTMSQALETTQRALNKFYGSLSDEQKAQFDRMNIRSS